MEKEKIKIFYWRQAETQMVSIADYIESKGYPDTAKIFPDKLYDFGDSLASMPLANPMCRNKIFLKYELRCAVFHKDYVFAYKVSRNRISIHQVVHGSRLK